jgi:hypothetical protein
MPAITTMPVVTRPSVEDFIECKSGDRSGKEVGKQNWDGWKKI